METAANDPPIRPPKAGKRARRRAATERRLIEATMDLIRDGGIGALTTVAIAKRAGIAQPNFYAYFKNVDDLLGATARFTAERLLVHDLDAFQRVRDAVERGEPHMELTVAYHEELLDILLEEPRYAELFFRHRNDSSAYGRELRQVERRFIEGVTEHLWDWGIRVGLRGQHLSDIRLLAELQVADTAAAVLALLEGRQTDRRAVARMIAHNADATTRTTFRRLLAEGT